MGFKVAMALAVYVIPGIMVFFGGLMLDHPPKTINAAYGYRTAMSMLNQDTWDYAQAACAERWRRWGRVLALITLVVLIFALRRPDFADALGIYTAFETAYLLASVAATEMDLRRTFDREGRRKA
ncbi:SdpI family protein [Aedoeadaptatus acetigenes]|uniref:SdpI family protein n=1 Tax=Aedoeadaptatus acetigenes TaxID=2981723 RepID=UPI002265E28D|nr:SdpI family protein [Aedoeadaptatus acetigenes]MCU6786846.1 SdpI family protein [Aedoeadaptatus acetigenes]